MTSEAPARRAGRRAEADGALGEHGHRVAEAHLAALGGREPRRHDVGAHQHFFVGEAIGYRRKIRHRVRDQHELGLTAVDGVAELPAANRLPTVCRARAVLGAISGQTRVAVAAGRDCAGDHSLTFLVAANCRAEFLDHADGFVSDDQPFADWILAFHDVDVSPADRRGGNAQQRIERTDFWNRPFIQSDPARLDEHGCFHEPGHPTLRQRLTARIRARASAAATWRLTATKLSGLTDIESMPHPTRNSANSG